MEIVIKDTLGGNEMRLRRLSGTNYGMEVTVYRQDGVATKLEFSQQETEYLEKAIGLFT